MGALANERHCDRCTAGTGHDDQYMPYDWALISLTGYSTHLTMRLCGACQSALHDWLTQENLSSWKGRN